MDIWLFIWGIVRLILFGLLSQIVDIAGFLQQRRVLSLDYRIGYAEYDVIPRKYYRVIIDIINSGNRSITPDAYYYPISVQFAQDSQILKAAVLDSKPDILKISVLEIRENIVELDKLLLNAKNSIKIEIWLQNFDRIVSVNSHIADVRNQPVLPFSQAKTRFGIALETWFYKIKNRINRFLRSPFYAMLGSVVIWIFTLWLLINAFDLLVLNGTIFSFVTKVTLGVALETPIPNTPIASIAIGNNIALPINVRHLAGVAYLIFYSFLRRRTLHIESVRRGQIGYLMLPESILLTDKFRLN